MNNGTPILKFTLRQSLAIAALFILLGFSIVKMGRNLAADGGSRGKPMLPGMMALPALAYQDPHPTRAATANFNMRAVGNLMTKLGDFDSPGFYEKIFGCLDRTMTRFICKAETPASKSCLPRACDPVKNYLH